MPGALHNLSKAFLSALSVELGQLSILRALMWAGALILTFLLLAAHPHILLLREVGSGQDVGLGNISSPRPDQASGSLGR